ncbi:zinc-binding dehydrogenase [Mesorhizobium sp. M0220]|uniref:zinc-binding dehydrogenase n=1 Tax=Mesorhizobium sp. M0220 TaxID=2956920 RepID=UPI003336599C
MGCSCARANRWHRPRRRDRRPADLRAIEIACALYGRIVLLTIQDAKGGTVQIPGPVYQRSLATISRLFVGNRTNLEAMLRAISVHRLKPVIDKVFAFDEAQDAYRYFQQGDVFGKVVVDGA